MLSPLTDEETEAQTGVVIDTDLISKAQGCEEDLGLQALAQNQGTGSPVLYNPVTFSHFLLHQAKTQSLAKKSSIEAAALVHLG